MGRGDDKQVLALVLHSAFGKQSVQVIPVVVKMTGIPHVYRHLGASVTVPAVHALNNTDAAHNVGVVEGFQISLKHAAYRQISHLNIIVDEIGVHLIAGMEHQAVGYGFGNDNLI